MDSSSYPPEVVTVCSPAEVKTRQQLSYFVGISSETSPARHVSLNLLVVPPGGRAQPHRHRGYETAIYVLQGRVETRYGDGLRQSVVNGPGDFLFIPPGLPHQPINLSDAEPAMAVVARNDPNQTEDVELYEVS
jgi:uncharacterized RmlC-like cupin family protein